jgi:phage terminase Nu1 subunit (DNA packaging protein)
MAHVTTDILAKALDMTPRRVRQLAAERVFHSEAHGKWDLAKCLLAHHHYLQKQARSRNGTGEDGAEAGGLTAERERRLRVQRERDEIRLSKERGALIPIETYRREFSELCSMIRDKILRLPRQLASELEGQTGAAIESRLDIAFRGVLSSLSDGKPAPTRQPRKPRQPRSGPPADPAESGAAAQPESVGVGGPEPLPAPGN